MPLVRIELLEGWSEQQRAAIADATHAAMVATLSVPERDRFQIITMHAPENFSFDRSYLEVNRSDRFVLITVTLSVGRTTEAKQAFYAQLRERLVAAVGLRGEDLAVALVENQREDWSFGHGQASYLVLAPEQWR
ncbi:MAG: tautomerase family protein [Solirubrobacterales bacterium]|nr:tautomerase family protein [Solirubrobacterales bacterium]MBV9048230.1 tautomerase family protein [Solirubrobacterales bacterium]